MKITAKDLLELGIIEKVIPEVDGGVEMDFMYTAHILKEELIKEINSLLNIPKNILLDDRYNRFRKIGEFEEF